MAVAAVVSVLSVSNSFAQTIAVGRNPGAVALSPDGKTLYVANRDDHTVGIVSTGSAQSIDQVPVGGTPGTIALSPDGRTAYVALTIGMQGGVAILDTTSRRATQISTQCPVRDLALIPNGGKLYLAEEFCGLQLLRLADRSTVTIDSRLCPEAVAVTQDGRRAYVNYQCDPAGRGPGHDAIIEFDATTDRPLRTFTGSDQVPIVNVGGPLTVSPDGETVWANGVDACRYSTLACGPNALDQGIINILEVATGTIIPKPFLGRLVGSQKPLGASVPTFFPDGKKVAVATETRILVFDAGTLNQIDTDDRYQVPQAGRLAFTADGRYAYVASANQNAVYALSFGSSPQVNSLDRAWARYRENWTDSPIQTLTLHATALLLLWGLSSVAFARVFARIPVLKLPLELEVYLRGQRARLIRVYADQLSEALRTNRDRRGAHSAVALPVMVRKNGKASSNSLTSKWVSDVVELVRSKPRYRASISGSGGAGKTFLVEELILALIGGGCVPILLQAIQFEEQLTFEGWIDGVLREARVPISPALLRSLDYVVFVFDQASEVRPAHQEAFWKMVAAQFEPGAGDSHVIVAGRWVGDPNVGTGRSLAWDDEVEMAPLADEDIRALGQAYLDPSGESDEIRTLPSTIRRITVAPTPFIVSAYARARTSSSRPITNPEDLYEEILDRYMRQEAVRLRPDIVKLVLRQMVLRHYGAKGNRGLPLERYELEREAVEIFRTLRLEEVYGKTNVPEPTGFVRQLLESGLVYRTPTCYLFFHDAFEDWLSDAQVTQA